MSAGSFLQGSGTASEEGMHLFDESPRGTFENETISGRKQESGALQFPGLRGSKPAASAIESEGCVGRAVRVRCEVNRNADKGIDAEAIEDLRIGNR